MTPTPDERARSPWIGVWFTPRRTIERLVEARPTRHVRLLAVLGTLASIYSQIVVVDGSGRFLDWQVAPFFVLLCALVGLASLYVDALTLSWIGRLLGGRAPALHLRAVFAWSMLPTILGGVVVLAIGAGNSRLVTPDLVPPLVAASSLWSVVVFLLMLGRVEHFGIARTVLTYLLNLALAVAVAFVVRSFLYQPFDIPARSMRPALLVGDDILVAKFAYGYSRYSLPYSPRLISGRIFASEPARGDVVVFRVPTQNLDYVKRVVGLPGDRLQMKDGQLYINGSPVKREEAPADAADGDACATVATQKIRRWRETLPNGVSYETIDCLENGPLDNTGVYTVPPGQFFMLGDNRDNSTDSRASSLGDVPFENLIGRVSLIFLSRDAGDSGAAPRIRIRRIGMVVR
jgi:signal peptidase I